MGFYREKKHLKRWPAYLMRFLLLTSPSIPLPFQRGFKMINFVYVFLELEIRFVRVRVLRTGENSFHAQAYLQDSV